MAPQEAAEGGRIICQNEAQVRKPLDHKITEIVEETLNKPLDVEADRLSGCGGHERILERVDLNVGRLAEPTTVPTQANQVS